MYNLVQAKILFVLFVVDGKNERIERTSSPLLVRCVSNGVNLHFMVIQIICVRYFLVILELRAFCQICPFTRQQGIKARFSVQIQIVMGPLGTLIWRLPDIR